VRERQAVGGPDEPKKMPALYYNSLKNPIVKT
jgi:hypothetical protein